MRLFLTVITIALLSAQSVETNFRPFRHNVGAAAGFVSGYGLSYRQWGQEYGWQATLTPLINNTRQHLSVGLLGLKSIHQAKYTSLYGYFGGHVNYYDRGSQGGDEIEQSAQHLWIGGGPGIEVKVKNISLNLMLGIAAAYHDYLEDDEETEYGLQITGEFCLYYAFGK